jgi:hypothetical protein
VKSPSVSNETRLSGEPVSIFDLTGTDRSTMFEIFSRHYDCVSWERFNHDLDEKDCAILLRDTRGSISGFSTQKLLRAVVDDVPVRAVFSGDTVVDRSCWGEQELGKAWCRYVAALYAEEPETRLFWFLISKGFRTYLYLPLFFHDFYPCRAGPTPRFEQRVLDTVALAKFPGDYQPQTGLITFPDSQGQLKSDLAEVPERRLKHPHVKFFLERNPDYWRGTELACLAEISPLNMQLFAGRIVSSMQPAQVYCEGAD